MSFFPPPLRKPDDPLPVGDRNANPSGIGFLALVAEDFRTHGSDPTSPGFWALAVHRFGNWRMGVRTRALRGPLTALYRLAHHAVIARWHIDLPYNAKLGRRLRIGHHGCVHIGAREIGDDVLIRHSVTIGLKRGSERSKTPTIGSGVEIGPGACIVGAIHVGDHCYVGPNTVLAESLPPGTAVLGVPARRVKLEDVTQAERTSAVAVEPRRAAGP